MATFYISLADGVYQTSDPASVQQFDGFNTMQGHQIAFVTESSSLVVSTEIGTYLNYTQFTPSAQTVVSFENHATLPQFGLFTTEYTSATVVTLDTQLKAMDSAGDTVKLGQELILIDTGDGDRYSITINNGVITPIKL